jgi:hypothetical protein
VPWRSDGAHYGRQVGVMVEQVDLMLDGRQVVAGGAEQQFLECSWQRRQVRRPGPELPLSAPQHIASVRKRGSLLRVHVPTDVILMRMRDHDSVDRREVNAFSAQIVLQLAVRRREAAATVSTSKRRCAVSISRAEYGLTYSCHALASIPWCDRQSLGKEDEM